MGSMNDVMSQERFNKYVVEAAKASDNTEGFGLSGCDPSQRHWWAAYTRQSLREQAENDRIGEYLLTCSKIAKERGVMVLQRYVIYDNATSEHLERSGMMELRKELIANRRISGVIIPTLGRLSMDDHHRLAFEKECAHYEVQVVYGDAPGGMDIGSMFARAGIAMSNMVRVDTNRKSALAGNIARVLAGKVPSHRAPYGYHYRREAEIDQLGKKIQALFRARLFYPVCGKTMSVMRKKTGRIYYHCREHYKKWKKDPCPYNRFVPQAWDQEIWQEIQEMLKDDIWVE